MVEMWQDLTQVPAEYGPAVVTIGNFDGVHRGHRRVLSALVARAKERGIRSIVVTFDPHPARLHRPEHAPELIMGLQDRIEALAAEGVDGVLVMEYTHELSLMTARGFVQDVLVDGLHASAVVIGHDTRFGAGNGGDVQTMRELGAELGFAVDVIDEFGTDDDGGLSRRCSSTWVRETLAAGDVAQAAVVLGRPHRMRGEVVHGAARGRELGFPTANLSPASTGFVPADGIYAGWLLEESGTRWPAAISVGSNPTFEGVERQVEAFVIGRPQERVEDFNLYGQRVVLEFVERLRGMVAYRGPEALVEQMCLDVAQSKEILGVTV
ncbi:bifunctional riboflavin kinase/FAD synthetase [Arthrobacter sp. NPDC090010]|uniref:bifunctional riboflavin kinase/FAD synthetase n=1 Tax=Arthrobacter sp. NPDC090010 TaxID=3363942 RepID=UPI003807AC9D